MKRIGKILLIFTILIVYMGIICLGVMVVIEEPDSGSGVSVSGVRLGSNVNSRKENLLHSGEKALQLAKRQAEEKEIYETRVERLLAEMTMEQKLAQMMILTNEKDITAANLQMYQPGGIILFEVDFRGKTMDTVKQRVDTLQSYMQIPLFVGVDEEGGEVSRVKNLAESDLPVFESARTLCEKGLAAVASDTEEKMQYLKKMGLNLNFAPVADVVNQKNSYMYKRSASGDAKQVCEYVETVLSVMEEQAVAGCVKHFPGYGDNVNTHAGLAVDSRELAAYEAEDFLPFEAGIDAGVDMIMVSHIIMSTVDEENPSSLSLAVHDILRKDMGFSGVMIADDLNMQAILSAMTIEEATGKAFVAGNDMVFSADFTASMRGAKKAVEQGMLTETQVNDSVKRILLMKLKNGLIEVEE